MITSGVLLTQYIDQSTSSGQSPATTQFAGPILLQPQFGFTSLSQAINTLVAFAVFAAAIATFLFLVLGAFRYITAGESEANTRAARRMVANAIVGLILMALTFVAFRLLVNTIPGLDQLFNFGP